MLPHDWEPLSIQAAHGLRFFFLNCLAAALTVVVCGDRRCFILSQCTWMSDLIICPRGLIR